MLRVAKLVQCASLAAVVAAGTSGVDAAQGINCETGLMDACIKCFVDRELEVTWVDGVQSDPRITMQALMWTALDPLVQCRSTEKYKEALECMLNHLEFCQTDTALKILPDFERAQQGMDIMCTDYFEANIQCLKTHFDRSQTCAQNVLANVLGGPSAAQQDEGELVCVMNDVQYDCLSKVLQESCDPLTTTAFLLQARLYFGPRACLTPDTDPGRERPLYVEPSGLSESSHSPTATPHTLLLAVELALLAAFSVLVV